MGWWSLGVMVGTVLGPALGGYLAEFHSWRWAFYINVPLGVVAFGLIYVFAPRQNSAPQPPALRINRLPVPGCGAGVHPDRAEPRGNAWTGFLRRRSWAPPSLRRLRSIYSSSTPPIRLVLLFPGELSVIVTSCLGSSACLCRGFQWLAFLSLISPVPSSRWAAIRCFLRVL